MACKSEGEVFVSVEDNGPGVSDAEKEEVLQRFKRGSGEWKPGSGLGLYIVKMLVERYAGELVLEDVTPGLEKPGLRIRFTLKDAS